uniref:Uncharacterized protein n=1 Tax=Caenorhabditis tropicalis TaxID=1561998 RepID=A0A1I7UNV3_9PELO
MFKQRQEDIERKQWWNSQLCPSDQMILKKKREEVQKLIKDILSEPVSDSSDSSLAIVPIQPQKNFRLDWDSYWPSIDHFYHQISLLIGLNKEPKPIRIEKGENAVVPTSQFVSSSSQSIDIKSLRTVMEKELEFLGVARLHQMECSKCGEKFSSERLYMSSSMFNAQFNLARCGVCWRGKFPKRSIFDHLITEIAVKWAKMVEKRVECLYGKWDDRLSSMVRNLKENVLLADDIAKLLRLCKDPEEFKDSCEVIIVTTIVFYLEYVDFRRSCEALLKLNSSVTHCQLFEIFAIYFPNRAKGIKTGDFL